MNDIIRLIRRAIRPYQEFILPVSLIIATAFVVVIGILPGIGKVYEVYSELQSERDEIAGLQKKAQFLGSLDEATLFDQLSSLTSAIPVDKSIPTILSTIDGVSAKTGSVFSSLQLSAPGSIATEAAKRQTTEEAALGSYILPFTINMDGTFPRLRDTLATLTASRRLLRIKNFTISFQGDLGRALLSMDTLYAPLPATITGKPLVPLTSAENALLTQVASIPDLSKVPVGGVPSGVPRPDPFSL